MRRGTHNVFSRARDILCYLVIDTPNGGDRALASLLSCRGASQIPNTFASYLMSDNDTRWLHVHFASSLANS